MCRAFPDAADLFSGANALCRYGIYRQSSTSENAVFVEIQQRCIEVRRLSPGTESDPNKSLDDIFKETTNISRFRGVWGAVWPPPMHKRGAPLNLLEVLSQCREHIGGGY